MRFGRNLTLWLIPAVVFATLTAAQAEWETDLGLRAGYDSNLDRAISHPQGSGSLAGYLSLTREPDGESRWGWSLGAHLEGTTYFNLSDLNGATMALAPGVTFFPHKDWIINISPFGQAKSVVDSEQSSLAWGGKIGLKQRWGGGVYSGQYYLYRDSRAQMDTYSYIENTLGIFLGWRWSAKFFAEVGYEISAGDSFLTIGQAGPTVVPPGTGEGGPPELGGGPDPGAGAGPGRHSGGGPGGAAAGGEGGSGGSGGGSVSSSRQGKTPRYSSAFNSLVVREKVQRQVWGFTIGFDWNPSVYSLAGYSFTTLQGESGNALNHTFYVTTGYRF